MSIAIGMRSFSRMVFFFAITQSVPPDDVTVFADCQTGFSATGVDFLQGYARGIGALERGANDEARGAGLHPLASVKGHRTQNTEIGTHAPFREWVRLMEAGMAGRKAYA